MKKRQYSDEQRQQFYTVLNAEAERRFVPVLDFSFPEVYSTPEWELYEAVRDLAEAYMSLEGDESIPFTPLQRKKLRRLYWLPWVKLQAFGLKFWNWPSVPKSQNFISRLTLEEQIYWLQVVNTI